MADDDDRKQRVIHTRVSESMEEELKDRAASLGISVSNLVRNVLGNTLGLVEDIVADSASVARSARGDSRRPPQAQPPAEAAAADAPVVAWQVAVLNLNAVCGGCNDILPRGREAAVAVTDRAGPRPVLCMRCLEELRDDRDRDDT